MHSVMDDTTSQYAEEAFQYIKDLIPPELDRPAVGMICGSGLGGMTNTLLLHPRQEVHYEDIPHFPESKGNRYLHMSGIKRRKSLILMWVVVHGHAGKLLFGLLGSSTCPVVLMVGRAQSVYCAM